MARKGRISVPDKPPVRTGGSFPAGGSGERTPPNGTEISKELQSAVCRELPRVWLYRNSRLVAKVVGRGGKVRTASAGTDGQGDLTGVIAPHGDCICQKHPPVFGATFMCPAPTHLRGRRIDVEAKARYATGHDKQSLIQEAFEVKLARYGGVYMIADGVEWGADNKPDVSGVIARLREACG